jgi:hypothetical protein
MKTATLAVTIVLIALAPASAVAQAITSETQPTTAVSPQPPRLLTLEVPKQSPAKVPYDAVVGFDGGPDIIRVCFSWAGSHYAGWSGPYCFKPYETRPGEVVVRLRTNNPGVYTLNAYAEYGNGPQKTNTISTKTGSLEVK